ncbi:uracil-DNA glycosylase [Halobaculum gomorrense]|uniref:Uracil-DNA glycosylase, family 4 n=1 Tax=Halobaculum gomorrense TaxID=43928 RepID=A0A1M5QLJ2_9EURY|nr:uracil-DNA glycosylase family protein [Halobaculum gomorrense]SHH14987.1 uracil-DNA glycosylase, family 4 [Halobaculum gomorrense]
MTAPGDPIDHPDPADRLVIEPDCSRCPALVDTRTRISWGNGPRDASVLVVGEAPGAGDPDADTWKGGNHTGCAYTSRHSGRRVRRLMADLGYGGDCLFTNAVKCHPPGNRDPTDEELRNCRGHLETELDIVDPETVVTTGKHATATLLAFEGVALDGFLDRVSDPVDCPTLGVRRLPVLHPSYREVWLSRLDLTEAEYRARIAEHLP